jgi:hypothetical protein
MAAAHSDTDSSPSCELSVMSGGLNRSMQHWLAVYSPAFESPRSLVGVD